MKLKDTIKLIKYLPSSQMNIVLVIAFGFCALVTTIPSTNNYVGAFWANYLIMYFITQLSNIGISGLIQTSEKYKKIYTRNMALLLAVGNLILYLIFGVFRTFLAYKMGMEENVKSFLIAYVLCQLLFVLYATLIYKKAVLGVIFLILMFIIVVSAGLDNGPMGIICDHLNDFGGVGFYLVITAIVCILMPFIYYGLSLLLYKLPYNQGLIRRIERQNTSS